VSQVSCAFIFLMFLINLKIFEAEDSFSLKQCLIKDIEHLRKGEKLDA